MSLDVSGILAQVASHAQTLGRFEQVRTHEPKNAPGSGLNVAVWVDRLGPIPRRSGLAATSALLVFNVRVYNPMITADQDAIDTVITDAVSALIAAYTADFDLAGTVAEVDLLGAYGAPLEARAGYLKQEDKIFRTMVITLPLVINDAYPQAA